MEIVILWYFGLGFLTMGIYLGIHQILVHLNDPISENVIKDKNVLIQNIIWGFIFPPMTLFHIFKYFGMYVKEKYSMYKIEKNWKKYQLWKSEQIEVDKEIQQLIDDLKKSEKDKLNS